MRIPEHLLPASLFRAARAGMATLGRRGGVFAVGLALGLGFCAPPALAQAAYYLNSVTPNSLPAGNTSFTLTANVATGSSSFNLCFNSGYGASATPLVPTSSTSTGNGYIVTVTVPASSIQQIPASAYTDGSLNVYVYGQDASIAACTFTGYSYGSAPVQLNFPSVTSLSLASIPDQNPNLKNRIPSNLNVSGSNFLPNGGGGSSVVTYTGGSVTDSSVPALFVSSTEIRGNLPTNIPPGSGTLTVTACNQSAGNSYCAAPQSLTLNPLAANPGTLTATPNPPAGNQSVLFSAVFGPAQADFKNGAPGGLVSFADGSTALGTAALILNNTALLTTGESENNGVNNSTFQGAGYGVTLPVQPIVADMNNDGVPDSVILDPQGRTFHILLGVPPYATDHPLSLASESFQCTSYPSFAIADFNGDGIADIAFVCSTTSPTTGLVTNNTYVMLGLGDGSSFTPQTLVPRTLGSMIAAGDFNGDGKADLVTLTNSISGNQTPQVAFQVFTGNGDGTFNLQDTSGPFAAVPTQLVASDLNGDGATDLVLLASAGGQGPGVYTFQNQKDGNARFGSFAAPLQPINGTYSQVVVSPLVVSRAANPQCSHACTLPSLVAVSSSELLTAVNTSTTSTISFFSTLEETDTSASSAAAGDFNGDGYVDIAVVGLNGVEVLSGDGLGEFVGTSYPSLTDTTAPTNGIVVGAPDENGDGFADLLVLNQQQPNAYNIVYTEQGYITSGTSAAVLIDASGFAPGAHTITATTPGTYTIAGGSASTSFSIASPQTASTVTLSATPPSGSAFGQVVTVTAGIAGTGSADPSGTVSFYNGSQLVATVSLAGTSNPGTVMANYGYLHPGTYTLSAVYSGDANYTGSTGTLSYVIIKGTPVVNWTPNPSTIPFGTPLSSAQLDATANQGGSFVYTPSAGAVLSAGPQVLTVVFTPSDTTDCNTVTKTVTITVTQATPTVTWSPNPDTIVYGTPLGSGQLDASASIPGTFAYTPAAGTVLNAGLQTLTSVFTPTDTTDYQSVTTTTTINVTQATPSVTWQPNPDSIAYGTPLSSAQLDATSPVAGSFAYTPAAGAVLNVGQQTLSAVFTPTNTSNYKSVTATATITVTTGSTTITWTPNPSTITYGTALSSAQLDAVSTIPGSFAYTPAAGTVLNAGTQTLTAVFTPTSGNYQQQTVTTTITVTQATPSITWNPNPSTIAYGTPLSSAQLDATSPVAGTFAYTPAAGTVLPSGTQTLTTVFTPTSSNYKATTATTTITVTASNVSITWNPNPSTITYGTALGAGQLDATATVAGSFVYTPAAGTVLDAGTQTLTAVFTPSSSNYQKQTVTTTITVTQATPSITWNPSPSTIAYGTPLGSGQLDATSSIAGTFAYTPAAGTVLNAGTQTLSAVFTPTNTKDYKAVTTTRTITVTQATPSITWTPNPSTLAYGTPLSSAQLDATSSVAGSFVYTPASGTVLNAGTHTLSAVFTPTSSNYKAATATATVTVTQATPTITWNPNPSTITYGTALSSAQLDATANAPGSFAYTPAAGTVLSVGQQTLSAVFTPSNPTNYASVTTTRTITVSVATPTITWIPNPASISYGTPLSSAQLDATANVSGSFVYTPAAGTVLAAGTQTLTAVFTPTSSNYSASNATATITVTLGSPTITWAPNPSTIPYGTPLGSGQLDATSTIAGSFAYTPPAGTVLNAGQQTLTAVFTPTSSNYQQQTVTTGITVTQITPTISWAPNPSTIAYGTPLGSAQLDATSNIAGTFAYTPSAGTVLSAGTQTLTAVFTPSNTTNYKTVTTTATITVTVVTPTIAWTPNPATIPYGTPLSSAQLDATSPVAGTFTYTPSAGTVLNAGTQTLTVVFTPSSGNYKSATATTTLSVTQVTPSVTWTPNPASISYGTPLGAGQLDATSPVAGSFAYTPSAGTVLAAGQQTLSAVFTPTNTQNYKSVNATATITVTQATPTITWVPNPATIAYGTALSSAQLDATSVIPGSFAYTPAAGTVLNAGLQTLTAVFTPSSPNQQTVTTTTVITVTQATPKLTWPTPADIALGTALSATQLDATAAGVTNATLPGTFTYTPPAGTQLTGGTHQLTTVFTPTDTVNYTTASANVSINVISVTLASITPNTASLGDSDKTITLTGTGFEQNSSVLLATSAGSTPTPLATTYVSATTLKAIIPAADFLNVGSLQVSVFDPTQAQGTSALPLTITAPPVSVLVTGPTTTQTGLEPAITFQLLQPYPVDITGSFTLSFAAAHDNPDDPMIRFASSGTDTTDSSGRTFGFTIPAKTTATPLVMFQSGSTAGTITVNLTLQAGGANITPSTVQPLLIVAPDAVPGITSVSLMASGKTLTVVVRGYSNTRELTQGNFHFVAASGKSLATTDLQIDETSLFTQWYASAISAEYGSTFTYTQTFNLDEDATVVGGVQVILTNSVGASALGSSF